MLGPAVVSASTCSWQAVIRTTQPCSLCVRNRMALTVLAGSVMTTRPVQLVRPMNVHRVAVGIFHAAAHGRMSRPPRCPRASAYQWINRAATCRTRTRLQPSPPCQEQQVHPSQCATLPRLRTELTSPVGTTVRRPSCRLSRPASPSAARRTNVSPSCGMTLRRQVSFSALKDSLAATLRALSLILGPTLPCPAAGSTNQASPKVQLPPPACGRPSHLGASPRGMSNSERMDRSGDGLSSIRHPPEQRSLHGSTPPWLVSWCREQTRRRGGLQPASDCRMPRTYMPQRASPQYNRHPPYHTKVLTPWLDWMSPMTGYKPWGYTGPRSLGIPRGTPEM